MRSEPLTFPGAGGHELSGRLERPTGRIVAYALFAHCFTCGKASHAATRISRALAARGVAVLRFDFTGLGGSDGDFANTGFSSNVDDLVAAANHLRSAGAAPALLIGHSLGGAAVLAAAHRIPETTAVATLNAPCDTEHLAGSLLRAAPDLATADRAEAVLGGRTFTIRRELLEDLQGQNQRARIEGLRRALLVMHAPTDEVVGVENAGRIFEAARHPKSFVSLADADHFVSREPDAEYAAAVIAAWASRYLPPLAAEPPADTEGEVLVEETGRGKFQQRIVIDGYEMTADEPRAMGGLASGPTPYDLLAASLGACKSMTMRLYADQKGWPLQQARVRVTHAKVHAADSDDGRPAGKVDRLACEIELTGDLTDEQRKRVLEIAEKCPVHRTLTSEVQILTRTVDLKPS